MKTRWVLLASLIFLVLAGLVNCSPVAVLAPLESGASLSTPTPTIGPTNEAQPVHLPVQLPLGTASTETVKKAQDDLAQKLGLPLDGITITAIIGEQYSADAFYCRTTKDRIARDDPPAVITGFTILLTASGHRYEYHASDQTVVFCRPLS